MKIGLVLFNFLVRELWRWRHMDSKFIQGFLWWRAYISGCGSWCNFLTKSVYAMSATAKLFATGCWIKNIFFYNKYFIFFLFWYVLMGYEFIYFSSKSKSIALPLASTHSCLLIFFIKKVICHEHLPGKYFLSNLHKKCPQRFSSNTPSRFWLKQLNQNSFSWLYWEIIFEQ